MKVFHKMITGLDSWRAVRTLAIVVAIGALVAGAAGGAGEPSPLFVITNGATQGLANSTATVLSNGKVLITGGDILGSAQATADIYNPATGALAVVGALTTPRTQHSAVLLNDGTVLITGGIDNNGNFLNTAEIYNPSTASFTCVGPSATPPCKAAMNDSRANHTMTALLNGQVMIAGGKDAAGNVLNTAEIYDPRAGKFFCAGGASGNPATCNPSMNDSRIQHTATLLKDGSVLLIGGKDNAGNIVSTAERFFPGVPANPAAGVFHATGSMSDVRTNHAATLLNNGKVLVAGGFDGFDVLQAAEIYDPSSGTFSSTSSPNGAITTMTSSRQNHTATLLDDGRALLIGGADNAGNLLSSAETYDPQTGSFTAVASQMAVSRESQTATLLGDGMVLVESGSTTFGNGLVPVSGLELFDPTPGFFVSSGAMATSRQFHTASLVFNGLTLITGGKNALGPLAGTEIYDGAIFSPGPDMSSSRAFHTATVFPAVVSTSGVAQLVLMVGGVDNSGIVHNDFDSYEVTGGTIAKITPKVPAGFTITTNLSHPRLGHTSTFLQVTHNALYAGGMTSDGSVLNNADIFTFNSNSVGFQPSAGTMMSSRAFHTATQLMDGTVLLAGGRDTNGNILSSAELYDPIHDSFAAVPNPMTDAREFHTATLLCPPTAPCSGRVLITGGVDNNGAVSTAEIYNPSAKTFTPVGRMAVARYFHSAVLLADGEVLIAGGQGNNNLVVNEAEIFDPVTLSFRPAPSTMLDTRAGQTATMLPSGLVLLAGGVDNGFNVTNSAELYDPPSGPQPAGVLASVAKNGKATGGPMFVVNSGQIRATNLTGSAESLNALAVALSNPEVFAQLRLTGQVLGQRRPQTEIAVLRNPGPASVFAFKQPLKVPPGGSVTFTLTGVLGSLRKAGATSRRPVQSVQTATAIEVSTDSGPVEVEGLPAGFGVVTLR